MPWNVPNCQKTLLGIWVFGIYPGKMLVRVWQTISFPISELKCLQTAQIKFASIAFRPKKERMLLLSGQKLTLLSANRCLRELI